MRLVCFGDSLTARTEGGEHPLLTEKLKLKLGGQWEIINSGVPGNNTFDALERVATDVIVYKPDLVIVFFGANDAAFHKTVPLHAYESNLIKIVSAVTPQKSMLMSPAPVDENKQFARSNAVLREYAEVVRKVSAVTNCRYIDLFSAMIAQPNRDELLHGQRDDGLHFGEEGYEFLADLLFMKLNCVKFTDKHVVQKIDFSVGD